MWEHISTRRLTSAKLLYTLPAHAIEKFAGLVQAVSEHHLTKLLNAGAEAAANWCETILDLMLVPAPAVRRRIESTMRASVSAASSLAKEFVSTFSTRMVELSQQSTAAKTGAAATDATATPGPTMLAVACVTLTCLDDGDQ